MIGRLMQGTLILIVLLGLGVAVRVAVVPASAPEPHDQKGSLTEAITPNGVADWTKGVIRATGLGFPPKDAVNALHAKTMAQRAAQSVAQRNLLEVLQGVRVDSHTTVNNYMVQSDEIHVRVNGMVKGAKIVKEQELPDGSFEVTIEMDLKGELSGLIVPKPTTPPKRLATDLPQPAKVKHYTGLVVDARGLGAQPALAPKILNEEGQEAYSVAYVEGPQLADNGIVVYVVDLPAAQSHPRVTSQPLVVKAVRTAGGSKADLVISNADAQTIHGVPDHYRFLQKAQVLVVLDKSK